MELVCETHDQHERAMFSRFVRNCRTSGLRWASSERENSNLFRFLDFDICSFDFEAILIESTLSSWVLVRKEYVKGFDRVSFKDACKSSTLGK